MEGFYESEMYYLNEFHSINDLKQAIHKYINFYNNDRYQGKLKDLTPMEYRNQALVNYLFFYTDHLAGISSYIRGTKTYLLLLS